MFFFAADLNSRLNFPYCKTCEVFPKAAYLIGQLWVMISGSVIYRQMHPQNYCLIGIEWYMNVLCQDVGVFSIPFVDLLLALKSLLYV